jgi:hypothetical protein
MDCGNPFRSLNVDKICVGDIYSNKKIFIEGISKGIYNNKPALNVKLKINNYTCTKIISEKEDQVILSLNLIGLIASDSTGKVEGNISVNFLEESKKVERTEGVGTGFITVTGIGNCDIGKIKIIDGKLREDGSNFTILPNSTVDLKYCKFEDGILKSMSKVAKLLIRSIGDSDIYEVSGTLTVNETVTVTPK